ncbi:antitoxin Xre/MbcA/ParS toxin-binding domain-containing protein [Blastopirellula marina]|uniref:Uncharacterized protein n=1 Tax=Blastopirellula marina TaxID=124 RepID=A0A2S8FSE0_9BACT|nr:antitoxin Xre/MbcA/ParS toxin-binding domain-containing protein [Blastopirellula marina]PQO35101.1 hypothetical protein C5Y98_14195 [Blastopirellula marina]PTL43850.1 DUF2384 domain-containing protein [Blastopirellula marina]
MRPILTNEASSPRPKLSSKSKTESRAENYSGDAAWEQFVALHRRQPRSGVSYRVADFPDLPPIPPEMTDVFTVAVSLFGPAKTKTWLTQPIPALDGQTPQVWASPLST